jgi:hypothetical protein
MKRYFSGSRFTPLENPQPNGLVRILGAWSESSTSHHNIEAFLRIGLVPFEALLRSEEYYLKVHRGSRKDGGGCVSQLVSKYSRLFHG